MELTIANPGNAMMSGMAMGLQWQKMRNQNNAAAAGYREATQNELWNNALRAYGPGFFAGDPSAVNALYGQNPQKAYDLQMDIEQNQRERDRFDMESEESAARLQMDAEQHRMAVIDWEKKASAEEKALAQAEAERAIKMISMASTPEMWAKLVMLHSDVVEGMNLNPEEVAGDMKFREALLGQFMTIDQVLKANKPDLSEAEQELARMAEAGVPRDVAIKIKEGVYAKDRHPTTGELQVVDLATGDVVWGGGKNETAPDPNAAPPGVDPAQLTFGDRFEDAPNAFGVEGAIRGVVNTVTDTIGAGPVWPETMDTQSDFRLLRENLLAQVSKAYDRQPPAWLLKEIRNLTPETGSVFEGPEQAQSKLRALQRQIYGEWQTAYNALVNTDLSPENRQKVEATRVELENAIQSIAEALKGFEGASALQINPEDEKLMNELLGE